MTPHIVEIEEEVPTMSQQDQREKDMSETAGETWVEEPRSDDVLTAREAARLLRISTDLLYEAANRGEVPHRRVGRRMLFSRLALLAWLRASSADGRSFRPARHGSDDSRTRPNGTAKAPPAA
jgi:excisionase family DNA binding protein